MERDRKSACALYTCPQHIRSEDGWCYVWSVFQNSDNASIEEYDDTIAQTQQFVEIGADKQHGAAALCHFIDAPMQEGRRRNVDAARRLVGDQEFRIGGKLARGDELLRIAAGKGI